MNNIIEELREKITGIDRIYEYPNDPNFHMLKFTDIDWASPQDSHFFNILRDLVMHGALSLSALTNLHMDIDHPQKSVYQIFYRILNGSHNDSNVSLQKRGIVKKEGRLFKLTPFGVLYAIHVFYGDKYYDKEHNQFTETDDFSYQKNLKGIFDIIKIYYSDYFPLFFDNLNYIRENKDIDINFFFDILDGSRIPSDKFYDFYDFSITDFSEKINEIVPFAFYFSTSTSYLIKHKKRLELINSINLKLTIITETIVTEIKEYFNMYNGISVNLFGKRD